MGIESYVIAVIEGKRGNRFIKGVLFVLSLVYKTAVRLQDKAYKKKLLKIKQAPLPIISVGNIVAGGTGKTPFVYYLAKELLRIGPVAILSRGYRREGKGLCLVSKATQPKDCGDEPYLLAQKLPLAHVIVGKKRTLSAELASRLGAKLALLDDGMQCRSLFRNVEIGMMHADNLFGQGHYLPLGFLRDDPKRLKEADLIVLTGIQGRAHFEEVSKVVKEYTDAPLVGMQEHVENGQEIAGKKVGAFCAISAPERFFSTLRSIGCTVVLKETKPDHLPFSLAQLESFAMRAKTEGAMCLVCTEKDAVKLLEGLSLSLPIYELKIVHTPTFGKEHLEEIIHKIKQVAG